MKTRNPLTDFPYRASYYVTHPWKFIKECYWNLRNAWMRVRYGWSFLDVWNTVTWFETVLPEMIRYLADHGNSYPDSMYSSYEEYAADLRQLAADIELLDWDKHLDAAGNDSYDNNFITAHELHQQLTFNKLRTMFDSLWD